MAAWDLATCSLANTYRCFGVSFRRRSEKWT